MRAGHFKTLQRLVNRKVGNAAGLEQAGFSGLLFQPSLQTYDTHWYATRAKPWSLGVQAWVALLGGSLAITILAFLNGRRLGLTAARQGLILIIGAMGFVATLLAAQLLHLGQLPPFYSPIRESAGMEYRLLSQAIALISYFFLVRLQRSDYRTHCFYRATEHASFVVPWILIIALARVQSWLVFDARTLLEGLW
ncbi:MAG: hypothetical protein AB1791_07210 [Chloroflexota bacterium]